MNLRRLVTLVSTGDKSSDTPLSGVTVGVPTLSYVFFSTYGHHLLCNRHPRDLYGFRDGTKSRPHPGRRLRHSVLRCASLDILGVTWITQTSQFPCLSDSTGVRGVSKEILLLVVSLISSSIHWHTEGSLVFSRHSLTCPTLLNITKGVSEWYGDGRVSRQGTTSDSVHIMEEGDRTLTGFDPFSDTDSLVSVKNLYRCLQR